MEDEEEVYFVEETPEDDVIDLEGSEDEYYDEDFGEEGNYNDE
jgi:hypothetical protein